ncbi:hypothetical protein AX17_007297 [Amanita inopinata Kibby_2008]|nr:hypothetical protein AX17_007297 [Amanita inopinata Kibby_2008]
MSLSWVQRKKRLASLLRSEGDEDADGLALDRLLHGQNVIGKTSRTMEIDSLRFQDKDLGLVGTLDYGQFGVIDVVTCHLDNRVYVRKSIEKRFALRNRDQCFPLFERGVLLQARRTNAEWAPHLLCAFKTSTHLNLVMDYAEGGTLWDVLESSPFDGKIPESDLRWWTPQVVSAIHWCHSQGFVHRDIKPHNFVLTPDAHVLLIDFGSAAPLLPAEPDGSQKLPKRYCLVPCGTCDYISPEILQAHEEALVALEMDDEADAIGSTPKHRVEETAEGYGLETDWWSLGAMLYELAYGVAPFFASDIRQTYLRIINHEKSLRFDGKAQLSPEYKNFLSRLLTHAHLRLGRVSVTEITDHSLFDGVDWASLRSEPAPPNLHLPQFTYTEPQANNEPTQPPIQIDESHSQGFAFSALFQSSTISSVSHGISLLQKSVSEASVSSPDRASSFIGFSWGPPMDAFSQTPDTDPPQNVPLDNPDALPPMRIPSLHANQSILARVRTLQSTPVPNSHLFSTPVRYAGLTPYQTLPRASTIRRTAPRRTVSDREAMKQLVDCVGMSARKKVLESGRKPRLLTSYSRGGSTARKELRFISSPIPLPNYAAAPSSDESHGKHAKKGSFGLSIAVPSGDGSAILSGTDDTESECPPTPTPRPGSAMSRRSGTPTISSTASHRMGFGSLSLSGGSAMLFRSPLSARSIASFGRSRGDTGRTDGGTSDYSDHEDGNVEEHANLRRMGNDGSGRPSAAGGRRRAKTISSSAPSVFDELEERHAIIMRDIGEIEGRLSNISRMVRRGI